MNIYFVAAVLGLVPQAYSFALQRRIFRGALASTTTVSKLSLADPEYVTLATPSGPMRTIILRPEASGSYPGVVFFSEIFQLTSPIMRSAATIAGNGFVVAVPEIYHSQDMMPDMSWGTKMTGWVGEYTDAGSTVGNKMKVDTTVEQYDGDATATINYLLSRPDTTARVGIAGFCVGGHLAIRAGFNPNVYAVASWYPTDMHSGDGVCSGCQPKDDTLARLGEFTTNNNGDGTEVNCPVSRATATGASQNGHCSFNVHVPSSLARGGA